MLSHTRQPLASFPTRPDCTRQSQRQPSCSEPTYNLSSLNFPMHAKRSQKKNIYKHATSRSSTASCLSHAVLSPLLHPWFYVLGLQCFCPSHDSHHEGLR